MWLVFLFVVLGYLAIGVLVALVMCWLLCGTATLGDSCLYAIAWPVVVVLAAFYWE